MTPAELLADAFGRIVDDAAVVVAHLDRDTLAHRVGPQANSIAWLVWHLARVQDDHVATAAGTEQVWTDQEFEPRFHLPFETGDIGFGHTSEQVAQVRANDTLLMEYLRAVHERTLAYLATLSAEDLDRVVDEGYDPPVTLGVRLVSVVNDGTQHIGQAAYVRGLLEPGFSPI